METRKEWQAPDEVQVYLLKTLPATLNAAVPGNEVHALKVLSTLIVPQKFGKLQHRARLTLLNEISRLMGHYAVPNTPAYPYLSTVAAGLLSEVESISKDRLTQPDLQEALLKAIMETLGNSGLPPGQQAALAKVITDAKALHLVDEENARLKEKARVMAIAGRLSRTKGSLPYTDGNDLSRDLGFLREPMWSPGFAATGEGQAIFRGAEAFLDNLPKLAKAHHFTALYGFAVIFGQVPGPEAGALLLRLKGMPCDTKSFFVTIDGEIRRQQTIKPAGAPPGP
jgi:hypothetical protein